MPRRSLTVKDDSAVQDTVLMRAMLLKQKADLTSQRDNYIIQVNAQIGQFNGRIAQIEDMLRYIDTPPQAEQKKEETR